MTARLGRLLLGAAGWAIVATVVVVAWPAQLGGNLSLVVVSGHSMDGTYRSGDLLFAWPAAEYAAGDVVVYRVPGGEPASGLRVVHRIVDVQDGRFTTQGDNRDTTDIWTPTAADVDGRPFMVLPAGGLVLRWLLSPIALALVAAVCIYFVIMGKDKDKDSGSEGADPGSEGPREPQTVPV